MGGVAHAPRVGTTPVQPGRNTDNAPPAARPGPWGAHCGAGRAPIPLGSNGPSRTRRVRPSAVGACRPPPNRTGGRNATVDDTAADVAAAPAPPPDGASIEIGSNDLMGSTIARPIKLRPISVQNAEKINKTQTNKINTQAKTREDKRANERTSKINQKELEKKKRVCFEILLDRPTAHF